MRALLVACFVAIPAAVAAQPRPDLAKLLPPDGDPSAATFGFAGDGVYAGASADAMKADLPALHITRNVVGGYSKDKKAYWASAELASGLMGASKAVDGHASALWEKSDTGWKLVAFAIFPTATTKQQRAADKAGLTPPAVPDANGASDVYFMTAFPGVIQALYEDALALRKDAVLFGSGPSERYSGAAKAAKTLRGWKLAFTVHDGISAGTTAGRMLWIAANVDARPANKPNAAPTAYRMFLILQGDASGDYTLVHASFGSMVEKPWL